MSKKYIIINGIKFPNNTFFGNLTSNDFDSFQDNIWAFESRVPDWMLKQLKDNFDSSVYNQEFESFYGKWNKFDKNSSRSLIDRISVYGDGKIDLTGNLDSAGQLDSTGAATEDEDPSGIIINANQTLDEEFTKLEENEEIKNLGDLDPEGLNFQEIKDELDSLDSSFKDNLTEIIQILDGLGIKTVMNGNDITGVNYESVVDPNSTSLEDDVNALDDKWNDIPQNDIQTFTDKLENYTSPEIPGNNLGQDLRNLQEIYAILKENSISDRVSEQNQRFDDFISKVELNSDLSYTNPIISSIQKDDGEIDEIGENSSVTETIEYAKRNLIDEDDTSVARLDSAGKLIGERESFFISYDSESTDTATSTSLFSHTNYYDFEGSVTVYADRDGTKGEISYKDESGNITRFPVTGKTTHLRYDFEYDYDEEKLIKNQLIFTNEKDEEYFAEITGQLTSIGYEEEDAMIEGIPYKRRFLVYYGEEYKKDFEGVAGNIGRWNKKNADGSWKIELPTGFQILGDDILNVDRTTIKEINKSDGDKQLAVPWIWVETVTHPNDQTIQHKVLKYYENGYDSYENFNDENKFLHDPERQVKEVLSDLDFNVRLSPSPNMLIHNGIDYNTFINSNFNVLNLASRKSDWLFDWEDSFNLNEPTYSLPINWVTRDNYKLNNYSPHSLTTMNPEGFKIFIPGFHFDTIDSFTEINYFSEVPLKPESGHPTFLFRLDEVPFHNKISATELENGQLDSGEGQNIFESNFNSHGAYKNLFYEYVNEGKIDPKTNNTIDWERLFLRFHYFEIKETQFEHFRIKRTVEDNDTVYRVEFPFTGYGMGGYSSNIINNLGHFDYDHMLYVEKVGFESSGTTLVQYTDPYNGEIKRKFISKKELFQNLDSLLDFGIDNFDYTTVFQAFRTEESPDESLYPYTKMRPKGMISDGLDEFPITNDAEFARLAKDIVIGGAEVLTAEVNRWNTWFSELSNPQLKEYMKFFRNHGISLDNPYVNKAVNIPRIMSSFNFRTHKLQKIHTEYFEKLHYPFKSLVFINENDTPQIVKVRENLTSIFTPSEGLIDRIDIQTQAPPPINVNNFPNAINKTEKFDRRYQHRYRNLSTTVYGVGAAIEDSNLVQPPFEDFIDQEESALNGDIGENEPETTSADSDYYELENLIINSYHRNEPVMYYVNEKHDVYKIDVSGINVNTTELRKTVDNDLYFIHEKVPHKQYSNLSWLFDENITTQIFENQLNSFDWQTVADSTDIERQNQYKPNLVKMNTIVKEYDDFEWYESGDLAFFRLNDASKEIIRVDESSNQNIENILKVFDDDVDRWVNVHLLSYKWDDSSLEYKEMGVSINDLVDEEQKCSITYHTSENISDRDRWKFKADETGSDISAIIIPPNNNSIDSLLDDRVLVKGEISRHFEIYDGSDPLLDLSSMSVERIDFETPSFLDFQQLNSDSLASGNDVRYKLTLENEVIENNTEYPHKFLKIGSEQKNTDYVKPSYPVRQDYCIYLNSDSEQEIDLQFRNHFIDLRTHDADGYETGSNFKGILKDGLYDGQEIKIWITNTGNNNTYSKLKFDVRGPFINPSELYNYYGNDDNVYDFGSFTSSDIQSKFLNQTIGERYKLPLGYMQAGRGMNNWTEDSSLGLNISARNISRFKTLFHNTESINSGSLDEKISHIQQQIENDTSSESQQRGIKGRGLSLSYLNYYKLKDVNVSLSGLNRFEDISLPRSLENSVEIMKSNLSSSDITIGRPVIKVINSLIPSHGVGDERSDFFTEFPAYEDYYYRVTEPEIVKFKVTSTSQWEQVLYELGDTEHHMHQPLRQYSQYRYMKTSDNSPDVVKKYSKSRENFRAYGDISNYDIFEPDGDVSIPYNKGVWSGDYWRSHYTTFATKASNYTISGDDHVLWKYEFIGDSRQIKDHKSNRIKPLSVDYWHLDVESVHLGSWDLTTGLFNEGGKPIPRPQEYPKFLNDSEKSGNVSLEQFTIETIYNGYAAWGEDYYGTGRRTRQWGNIPIKNWDDNSNASKFLAVRLKNESKAKYYFRRNRYSDPNFEYNNPDQINGLDVEQSKIMGKSVNILDDFKVKYQLNLPNYAHFENLKATKTSKKYKFKGVTKPSRTAPADDPSFPLKAFRHMDGTKDDAYYIFGPKQKYAHWNMHNYSAQQTAYLNYAEALAHIIEIPFEGESGSTSEFLLDDWPRYNYTGGTFPKDSGDGINKTWSSSIGKGHKLDNGGTDNDGVLLKFKNADGSGYRKVDPDDWSNIQQYSLNERIIEGWGSGIIKVLGNSQGDRPRRPYKKAFAYMDSPHNKSGYDNNGPNSIWPYPKNANYNVVDFEMNVHVFAIPLQSVSNYIGHINLEERYNHNIDESPGYTLEYNEKNQISILNGAINKNTRTPVIAHPIWNSHSFMLSGLNLDNGYAEFDELGKRDLINANDLHILYTGKGILQKYPYEYKTYNDDEPEIDRYFCEGHGTTYSTAQVPDPPYWPNNLIYLRSSYGSGKLDGLEQHPWVTGKALNPLFNSTGEKVEFFENVAKKLNDYYSDILPLPSYCFNFYDRRYRGNSSTFDFWYNEPYYTGVAEDHGKILHGEKYYKQNNKAHRAGIGYRNIESGFVFLDRRAESKCGSVFGRDFNFQNSKGERIINSETGVFNVDDVDDDGNRIFDQKLGDDLYSVSFERLQKLINSNKDILEPLSEASDNPNHLKDAILFHVDDNDVIISIYKPKFTRPQSLPDGVIAPDNYILDISEFKDNLRTGDSIILHYPKKIRPENFLDYKDVEPSYRTVSEDGKIDYEEIFSRYRQGILGVNLNINYAIGRSDLPPDKKGRILFDFTNPDEEPIELDSIKSYGWYSPGQNFQGCYGKDPVFESGDHWLLGNLNSEDAMWHCGLEAGFKEFVEWRIPLYIKNSEYYNHVPFRDDMVVAKPDPSVEINDASVYFVLNPLNDMRTGNDYNEGSQLEDIFDNDKISLGKIIAFNNNVTIHQPLIKRPGTGIIVRSGGAPELFQGHQDSPFPSNNEQISDNFYFERTRKVVPEAIENPQFGEDRRTKLRKMSNWQWGLFEFENTGEWVHEELKSSDCEYYSVAKPKYIDVSPLMYKCIWSESQASWILQGGSHSDKFINFNN